MSLQWDSQSRGDRESTRHMWDQPHPYSSIKEVIEVRFHQEDQEESCAAQSWEMRVDLGNKQHFPQVVQTSLRLDKVTWSASKRKANKYQDLGQQCMDKGSLAWLFPVEVGWRVFPVHSVWKIITALGIAGGKKKTAAGKLEEAVERISCWIWNRQQELSWQPRDDGQWLVITANPPTGGSDGSWSKHSRKIGCHLMTSSPGRC